MSDTKIKIAIGADHAGFEYKEIQIGRASCRERV